MGVSKNNGTPNYPFVHRVFHYFSPSILGGGSPYFWFNTHVSPSFERKFCESFFFKKRLYIITNGNNEEAEKLYFEHNLEPTSIEKNTFQKSQLRHRSFSQKKSSPSAAAKAH